MKYARVTVTAPVSAVVISAAARIWRTILQVLVSVGVTIPIILNTGQVTDGRVISILGIAFVVVTVLQNALEAAGVIPTIGGTASTPLKVVRAPDEVPELL